MTIPNMVAESKNSQLAGHQLQRPRETPPVGTPTQRGGAYISNSKNFHDTSDSPFLRAEIGLQNGIANLTPSHRMFNSRSLTHSVRGRGRGRGAARPGAFSSRPYLTPSTRTTTKALSRVFEEESKATNPFRSAYSGRMPSSVTPSRREIALSHPYLERQYARQMEQEDKVELHEGTNGSAEAAHKHTQSAEQPELQEDEKHGEEFLPALESERIMFLEHELAVARAQALSFQDKLDALTAMLMDKELKEEEKEKERKQAQELEEEERVKEKLHKEEMRQLDRDKKSACDQQRMKAMADAYVKQNGKVTDTEGYERRFLPYMETFFDQENTPLDLVDLQAELWTPVGETILHAKKRKELYFFITNVIDKETVGEKLESTIRENTQNDVQAVWRKMSKLLKRGETEGEGNSCLLELLKCTMQSTRKTISAFGGEMVRYQNLMIELKMEQSEEHMLIPLYLAGLSSALKDVKTYAETKIEEGVCTLAEIMKLCESKAKDKGLHNYSVKHQNSQEIKVEKTKKEKDKEKKDKKNKEKLDKKNKFTIKRGF